MLMHKFLTKNFGNQLYRCSKAESKLRIVAEEVVFPCTSLSVSMASSSDTAVEILLR